jgi:hypothetical protein
VAGRAGEGFPLLAPDLGDLRLVYLDQQLVRLNELLLFL